MKKLSLVIAALALVLGTSQCKKQEDPVGGKVITQKVTFTTSFGDGSKLNVEEGIGTLNLSWKEGDEITVTDGAGHSSTLNCTGVTDGGLTGTFTGEIVYGTGELTFTVGSEDGLYENQHFIEITKDIICLKGTSEFKQSGDYGEISMELPYAILKVDLSELATAGGAVVSVKIDGAETPAATVANVKTDYYTVYLLLPLTVTEPTKTTLTFDNNNGKIITKTYTLAPNGFYTGGGTGGYAPVEPDPDYLCFTAQKANSTVKLQKYNSFDLHSLQYNINGNEWKDYTFNGKVGDTITLANIGDKVYFRKADSGVATFSTNTSNYAYFVMSGEIAASGNVMSLIDPDCNATAIPGTGFCFYKLFMNCTSLTAAPELPATSLASCCYANMFYGCKSLTAAPALPATNLALSCYSNMFNGCTNLTAAPALPAPTLAESCYINMFYGCTNLTAAPALLPAPTLVKNCYYCMFQGCNSLTTAPALPATTLAEDCYYNMFNGCKSLTAAPALLPAPTMAKRCCSGMFRFCTSLTAAPELLATTLAESCYDYMFHGCSKLNYIKVHFTAWGSGMTTQWVKEVSETGTFYCPNGLPNTSGTSNIPTGWAVNPPVKGQ